MNTLGTYLRLTSYGESHGESVGAVLDGFPSDFILDLNEIQVQMDRRRPGQSAITTSRKETDSIHINSGLYEGKTTGAPIHIFIKNNDQRSKDYSELKDLFRPSHADYSYEQRYGHRDHRGGGRSSARVTAPWVAAGSMAQQWLEQKKGVKISAYVSSIGGRKMDEAPKFYTRETVDSSTVRCPIEKLSEQMIADVMQAKEAGDSLGGVIQCVVSGLEAGIGNPVFNKLSSMLGHAMLSINAVKGFEIGSGFDMSSRRGSEVNDQFTSDGKRIVTKSNHSGGIQGGISNGMDIHFKVAFKPTATISTDQQTVNRKGEEVVLSAKGRHDPCVVPRAVPIVEALTALVLMDAILGSY